jgi:8-oxo-dGTP pyrophosphatase MutT (NUDIX family)
MAKRTLRDFAFQSFWRLQRPATLGVRGVVVRPDGRVLLVRHTYTPGWHFPGGGVERKETALAALNRELMEEAGVAPTAPAQLVSAHANHAFFPGDHILLFRIDQWTQAPIDNRMEIAELGFFDPANPPEGTTGGTLRRIAELFRGQAVDGIW